MQYLESIHSRLPGQLIYKDIALTGTGDQTVECFVVAGTVLLRKLYGVFTDTTTFTNCTATAFTLVADAAPCYLTLAAGTDLSTAAVGSFIAKASDSTVALSLSAGLAVGIVEPAIPGQGFAECCLVAKTGSATLLKFAFSTTDLAIAAQIRIFAEFVSLTPGSGLSVSLPA